MEGTLRVRSYVISVRFYSKSETFPNEITRPPGRRQTYASIGTLTYIIYTDRYTYIYIYIRFKVDGKTTISFVDVAPSFGYRTRSNSRVKNDKLFVSERNRFPRLNGYSFGRAGPRAGE